jgi:outer membrane murein-binding lipoprotein Lpp
VLWIPLGAWIGALVIGVVILGFCGYEIAWKSRRLQADLRELGALAGQLTALRDQALATQQTARRATRAEQDVITAAGRR